jgi:hypothetical protein
MLISDVFQSGSLPVVLGPTNIESHFPPNSFINAGRFQSYDQLGEYVKQVGKNKHFGNPIMTGGKISMYCNHLSSDTTL